MKLLKFNRKRLLAASAKIARATEKPGRLLLQVFLLCAVLQSSALLSAQEDRWFQIEISIFSNENFNPEVERWDVDPQDLLLPANARPLIEMSEVLSLTEWDNTASNATNGADSNGFDSNGASSGFNAGTNLPDDNELSNELSSDVSEQPLIGPPPYQRSSNFKLPDIERDAFIVLPPSEHGFSDTNRTLDRSPSHRLLFHGSWRQPVRQTSRSIPIILNGGRLFDEQSELQGSVRFRFNPNADRVVVDANIWLTRFINNQEHIIQMIQSRDMRSNEFHYLDHPAMGIVVLVKPYTPPPLPPAVMPQNEL